MAACNAGRLRSTALKLHTPHGPAGPPTPLAAWKKLEMALAETGAELPAMLWRNIEPVLADLTRLQARALLGQLFCAPGAADSSRRPWVLLLWDNCCASNKKTGELDTYTCKCGDSYSHNVVKVRGGWGVWGCPFSLPLLCCVSMQPRWLTRRACGHLAPPPGER